LEFEKNRTWIKFSKKEPKFFGKTVDICTRYDQKQMWREKYLENGASSRGPVKIKTKGITILCKKASEGDRLRLAVRLAEPVKSL
jgi:hypothetical protein